MAMLWQCPLESFYLQIQIFFRAWMISYNFVILMSPSVLHNLQYRNAQDRIYTKAGPILVAVNPFKEIQLYGSKLVIAYKKKLLDSPHIYSIAETAYSQMMKGKVD
ncbi:hypothetical protein AABB24_029988 [Solanum stoloniferum]|uniref:Myosin motor domain-containing protein n=1 Tax=Solanum stoloniferum TaxID=62892 RepID=A0ABD2S133_9SOLN